MQINLALIALKALKNKDADKLNWTGYYYWKEPSLKESTKVKYDSETRISKVDDGPSELFGKLP
ncbi:18765_t:CDS:2, partial [Gigaspora margarita]